MEIWEQKKLFRWNKKLFSWLFKGYHLLEKWKKANTSFNFRLETICFISPRKAFCRQRVSESYYVRKETVGIDIFITPRNGDRAIKQTFRIFEWACYKNQVMKPFQHVEVNIYQSNAYRKDLAGYIMMMSQGFKRTASDFPTVLYNCTVLWHI